MQQFKGVDFNDKSVNDMVASAIATHDTRTSRLAGIKEIVDFLPFGSAPKEIISADKVLDALSTFTSLLQEPRVTEAETKAINEAFEVVDTLRLSDEMITEDQWKQYNDKATVLAKALGDATASPWKDGEGPVGKSLYSAVSCLDDQLSYIVDDMAMFYKVSGGRLSMVFRPYTDHHKLTHLL